MKKKIILDFLSLSFAELIGKVFGFIALAYLARTISPDSFGLIAFIIAFITYFSIFVDLGFDVISVKNISQNRSLIEKYVNNIISLKFVNSIVLYAILVIIAFVLNKPGAVKTGLLIYGTIIIIQAVSLDFVFQGVEQFKYISYKIIGRSILYLILVIAFVNNDADIQYVFAFMVITPLIFSMWHFVKYKQQFGKFNFELDKKFIKVIFRESFPLLLSVVMATIYGNLDMVMLGFIKSNYDVGIYSASYKLFLLSILPFYILLRVFLPILSRFSLTKKFKHDLFSFIITMILMGIIIMIPLFLLSNFILGFVFGAEYTIAHFPLKILAANGMIVCLSIAFGNPLTVWGKQKYHAAALSIGAVINIILNFILIPSYSYNGAAIATLLSESAVFVSLIFIFIKSTENLYSGKLA